MMCSLPRRIALLVVFLSVGAGAEGRQNPGPPVADVFEVMALARTLKVSPEWLLDKQLFESMLKNARR